jgi:uncharacterized cupredoxin-like copper-binding protein
MPGTRWLFVAIVAPVAVAVVAAPAVACGGLVGENGSIQLTRTTTLAAYHDGVERYVTSFEFTGQGKEVGSIVPLPAVPQKVERGGDWTLQRLEREVAPPLEFDAAVPRAAALQKNAEVILSTKIDALDITVLRGGGDAVGKWATEHGFLLTPDAPEMLDFYASRSPIFMAARFDATRAARLGQNTGDGTPIMVTMKTPAPWVPLPLAWAGRAWACRPMFLPTDDRPKLLAGGRGLALDRDEQASASLLDDLRSDKGMGWVPDHMWFTYLKLDVPAGQLDYDLAISVQPGAVPSLTAAGVTASAAHRIDLATHTNRAWWPLGAAVLTGIVAFGVAGVLRRRPLGTPAARPCFGACRSARRAHRASPPCHAVLHHADASSARARAVTAVTSTFCYSHHSISTSTSAGTTVRFLIHNHDPIAHEFIVGPPAIHALHQRGTHPAHPPVPGEVSVRADDIGETVYTFNDPGKTEFACHLPGHLAFGMIGWVTVSP